MEFRSRMLLLAALSSCLGVAGRDLYVDSVSGSDSNSGTTAQEARRTLDALATMELAPGDRVLLKRGSTFRRPLTFLGDGTQTEPIVVRSYGTGPKPEVLGSVRIKDWERHENGVYRTTLPRQRGYDSQVFSVYEYVPGLVPRRLLRRTDGLPEKPATFHFDTASRALHVVPREGTDPRETGLEVPVWQELVTLTGRSWIRIEGLTFLFGGRRHIVMRDCRDVEVRGCASLFVGLYGNPNIHMAKCERVSVLDCFLYENVNCGVHLTDQTTRCRVAGCTIVKCWSNDGVTIHSGGRDKDGVRQGVAGDHNIVENNVIGLCPEESIDITSGDYHLIRGNICYGNGNPGIIVGHDSDHIRIEDNISFGNARSGIQVGGNPAEGARGGNTVVGNLVYDNGYPGLEIQGNDTLVCHNTVVDAVDRAAVRINDRGRGSRILNNIIVSSSPDIRHPSVQFLLGNPRSFGVELNHNVYFSAARPDGRVVQTDEGNFTLAEMQTRYGTSSRSLAANPRFAPGRERHYLLTPDSPAVGRGTDTGLGGGVGGRDCGWRQHGASAAPPAYPEALITGDDDHGAVLWLWGKGPVPQAGPAPPFIQQDPGEQAGACAEHARACEQRKDMLGAWRWYEAALFHLPESAAGARDIRDRVAQFSADDRLLRGARRQFAEGALLRAQHYLAQGKKKWPLIAHYLQVAARSAEEGTQTQSQAARLLEEHHQALSAHVR